MVLLFQQMDSHRNTLIFSIVKPDVLIDIVLEERIRSVNRGLSTETMVPNDGPADVCEAEILSVLVAQ